MIAEERELNGERTQGDGPRGDRMVYVVDDDHSVRRSMRRLIESVGLRVAPCPTAQAFLDRFDPDVPGCAVFDVRMPGMSGLELQEHLGREGHPLPVIIVTGHGDVPMAVRAIRAGAVDFMEKPYRPQDLLDRVQQALARDEAIRRDRAARTALTRRLQCLTRREREVVELVVDGMSSKQIAEHFGLSPKTIHVYRAGAMAKIKAGSVAELARLVLAARVQAPSASGLAGA